MFRSERFYKKYGIENTKEYCNYHKFLTIEEIACKKIPHSVHSGLALVIGTLFTKDDKSIVFAKNIPLNIKGVPYLENVSIRLLSDTFCDNYQKPKNYYRNEYLPTKGTFQIQGEIVLLNKESLEKNTTPITTSELTARIKYALAYKLRSEVEISKYIEQVKNTFVPAIRVFFLRPVDQPLKLIKSHLYIRLMNNFTADL
ncbi:hypothetical protein ACFFRR_000050 [Megaselia abdita]